MAAFIVALVYLITTLLNYGEAIGSVNQYPVIWREKHIPVTTGHNEYSLVIKFVSPCDLVTSEIVHEDLVDQVKSQCMILYNKYFIEEVKEMCDTRTYTEVSARTRRFLLSTLLITFVVGVVVSFGLGVAGTSTAAVAVANGRSQQHALDEQEARLERLSRNLDLLQTYTEELETDYKKFKNSSPGTTYLISYLTTRFITGQQIMRETTRQWRRKKLNPAFFDYINFTLPCADSCPLEFATGRHCRLSEDASKLYMDILTPIVNTDLQVGEADPFDLIYQTNNQTCVVKYSGPSNIIYSHSKGCIYVSNIKYSNLILSPASGCEPVEVTRDANKYFRLDHCKPRDENDAFEFVQVKSFDDTIHLYCYGNNITIGSIIRPCPNETFVLPITTEFSINGEFLKGGEYKVSYQEKLNQDFTIKANIPLQPTVNLEHIKRKAEEQFQLNRVATNIENNVNGLIIGIVIVSAILIVTVVILFGVGMYKLCKREGGDNLNMVKFN